MERSLTLLMRELGAHELALIRELIQTVGDRGRTYISKQLCQLWAWRLPNGQLRDIAGRDLLRRLDQRGLIQLPPPRRASRRPGYQNKTSLPSDFVATPVCQSLRDFSVIEIDMVRGSHQEHFYNKFVMKYVTPLYLGAILISWAVTDGWKTILMKKAGPGGTLVDMYAADQVPWVWATRALCLLVLAATCVLIRMAWKRRARLQAEGSRRPSAEVPS